MVTNVTSVLKKVYRTGREPDERRGSKVGARALVFIAGRTDPKKDLIYYFV